MPKVAEDFIVFQKSVHGKKMWYVSYRDSDGNRLPELSLSVLKRMIYTSKKRFEPIENRTQALVIASKALVNEATKEKIFNRKKPSSPNFIEYVQMVWDYDNSPYIKRRLKENKPILKHTCNENLKAFMHHVSPLIDKDMTLKDIDKSNGGELTKIRDKVIDLNIPPTTKNKAFQAMRTALDYASQRSLMSFNYKDRLKNTKVEVDGTDPFSIKEINKILSYYNSHTEKGTYERYPFLLTALASTTGMRPNEISAFKKTEIYKIDRKNDCAILEISNAIDTDNKLSTRKNKDKVYVATYIPLIEEIVEFNNANPKRHNYCFWDRNHPEKHITKDYFKGIPFDCLCEIGIKPKDRKLSFYSLRKTSATLIANCKNIGAVKAAELLGHKDTYVTQKHYISNTPESAVANFNDIRELIKLPA